MDNCTKLLDNYLLIKREQQQLQDISTNIIFSWGISDSEHGVIPPEGEQLLSLYSTQIKANEQILSAIDKIIAACPDVVCKQLLYTHYIQGIRWEKIADKLSYSLPQIYRYKKKAIQYFEKKWKE